MKKVVSDFIATFGCETGYSGGSRTMYIKKNERAQEALRAVREKWPTLAFYVRISEDIPAEAQEKPVTTSVVEQPFQEVKTNEIVGEYDNPATTAQVDDYLIKHPIDRSAKSPYDTAAKVLGRTKEYVRDRYRKLRDKGLVEKESVTETTDHE